MTQDAIITRCYPNGTAEVAVTRMTACGGSCGSCESCIYQNELKTLAVNKLDAKCGQSVVIESKTSAVFSAAALVYIMPIVLFIIGYAVAYVLGASEGACILTSFLTLIISAAIIIFMQRKKHVGQLVYEIIAINE